MRIEQLMARPVQHCRAEDSLAHAASLMWEHDCGCLPVCADDERLVGIITDRDICMCALFRNEPLGSLKVAEAMARNVLACSPAEGVGDAEARMREARVRRLPVVDDGGRLVGIVSLADLAREADGAGKEISESEVRNTLAAICEPLHRALAA